MSIKTQPAAMNFSSAGKSQQTAISLLPQSLQQSVQPGSSNLPKATISPYAPVPDKALQAFIKGAAKNVLTPQQIQQILNDPNATVDEILDAINAMLDNASATINSNISPIKNRNNQPILLGLLFNALGIGIITLLKSLLPAVTRAKQPSSQATQDLINKIQNKDPRKLSTAEAKVIYKNAIELVKDFDIRKKPELKYLIDYIRPLFANKEQLENGIDTLNKLVKFKLIYILTGSKSAEMWDVDGTCEFKSLGISNNAHNFTSENAIMEKIGILYYSRQLEAAADILRKEGLLQNAEELGKLIIGPSYRLSTKAPSSYTPQQRKDFELAILRADFVRKEVLSKDEKIAFKGKQKTVGEIHKEWTEEFFKHARTMDEAIADPTGSPWYKALIKIKKQYAFMLNTARYGLGPNVVQTGLNPDRTVSDKNVKAAAMFGGFGQLFGIQGAEKDSVLNDLIAGAGIGGVFMKQPGLNNKSPHIVLWDESVIDTLDTTQRIFDLGLRDLINNWDAKTVEMKGPDMYVMDMYKELRTLTKGTSYNAFYQLPESYLTDLSELIGQSIISINRERVSYASKEFEGNRLTSDDLKTVDKSAAVKQVVKDAYKKLKGRLVQFDHSWLENDDEVNVSYIKDKTGSKIPVTAEHLRLLEKAKNGNLSAFLTFTHAIKQAAPVSLVLHPIGSDFQGHTSKTNPDLQAFDRLLRFMQEVDKLEKDRPDLRKALKDGDAKFDHLIQSEVGWPDKLKINPSKPDKQVKALINVWFNGLPDEPLVTYIELVMGKKLDKTAALLFENFIDYNTSMYGDSASDVGSALKSMLNPTSFSNQIRHITTRKNIKAKSKSVFIINKVKSDFMNWMKVQFKYFKDSSSDSSEFTMDPATGKPVIDKDSAKWPREFREIWERVEKQLKACPIMAEKQADGKTIKIVGKGIFNGATFKDDDEYTEFVFKEGGFYDLLFDPRFTHTDEVDHNVRLNMIADALAAKVPDEALKELIKDPHLLLDKVAPYRYSYALGSHHSFADFADKWDESLTKTDKPLYSLENAIRMRLPIATHRVISGSILAGIAATLASAGLYAYRMIHDKDAPSHQPQLMGERKPLLDEEIQGLEALSSSKNSNKIESEEQLQILKSIEEASGLNLTSHKELIESGKGKGFLSDSLINKIQNIAHGTIITSYFGLNLGWLVKNLFTASLRQPAAIIGNILGLGLIAVPPTSPAIQRAGILASIAFNMLGWFNKFIYFGQLDVKLPQDKDFLNKLKSEEDLPSKDKPYNTIGGKPYFACVQYGDLFRIGKEFEINMIEKGWPRWIARTASQFVTMGTAVKQTLDPKFAKDMIFNFPAQMEVTRGNVVNGEGKAKTLPHGAGYALAWGAFLPLAALVIGGVADIVKSALNKDKGSSQHNFDEPYKDPLLVSTALSATIPSIATGAVSPMVGMAAQGEPLTGTYIGVPGSNYNVMPVTNARLMAYGGIGGVLFSLLSMCPGNLGHLFSSLYDLSALAATLGNTNNSMTEMKEAFDAAAVQGSQIPHGMNDHYLQLARAEQTGNDKYYKEQFPRVKGIYGETHINEMPSRVGLTAV